jgi:predicted Zn-dependent protease
MSVLSCLPFRRIMSQSHISSRIVSSLIAFVLGVSPLSITFAQTGINDLPDLGESARAELSPQLERKIGESIMNQIRQREPSYIDDPEINDYLANLGRRLVEASDSPTGEFQFFAIRDNTVNAFAMFGGYIGINTGTMLTAQSESELAGVIAHEIAHVTQHHLARQIAKEKQNTIPSLVAMALGILAARSNTSVAAGTVASVQAGIIQSQLAYSRDFEREADRMGYQTLEKAGFDVRGMGEFFGRLQNVTRLYDNNAPVYLRSHPLTVERLSDMQNRAAESPYRQVVSSLEFHLIRARLRAQEGTPRDAVREFEKLLREKKYVSQAAVQYGLSLALLRARDFEGAKRASENFTALADSSPIIAGLVAEIRGASGDFTDAHAIYRAALQRFPQAKALVYGYAESLFSARDLQTAQEFLASQLQRDAWDYKLYGLQAKNYAAMGKQLLQHRAQAEFYYLQGQLGPAIEQLEFAQKAKDGNFYELSAVDARLRELRKQHMEEEKRKRNGG